MRSGHTKPRRVSTALQSIALPDGRALECIVGGAVGPALVLHHGTPSDATLWLDWGRVAEERGLRLLALSRPGYAGSTRCPGRSVGSAAADVLALVDAFEVPWFVTAGWSGGGPHALACAAALPGRCRAVATLAGISPFGEPELDWLAGMGPENLAEFGAAGAGEAALQLWLERHASGLRTTTAAGLAEAFGGLIPQVDRDALFGGFAERMASSLRRALEHGFDGWVDDDLAFMRAWEIDLRGIAAPVTVWQGDLDLMVPATHGARLAELIPTALAKAAPGHGHISLLATYRDEVVRDLLERAGASLNATQ